MGKFAAHKRAEVPVGPCLPGAVCIELHYVVAFSRQNALMIRTGIPFSDDFVSAEVLVFRGGTLLEFRIS